MFSGIIFCGLLASIQLTAFHVNAKHQLRTCQPNWTLLGDTCIRAFDENPLWLLNWPEAQTYCKDKQGGADLVNINSKYVDTMVQSLLKPTQAYWFWAIDRRHNGKFLMKDGKVQSDVYSGWLKKSNMGNQYCAAIKKHEGFTDWNCNRNYYFVCEKPAETRYALTCPDSSWIALDSTCVKLETTVTSWGFANDYCISKHGSKLANINNDRENLYVTAALQRSGVKQIWIGYKEKSNEDFRDMNGNKPAYQDYRDFKALSKTSAKTTDCISMLSNGQWIVEPCYNQFFAFLCQRGFVRRRTTCPDNTWKTKVEGSCIKAIIPNKSWKESRRMCKASGGDLVIVDSPFKWNALNDYIATVVADDRFWMGLRFDTEDLTYKWIDGRKPVYLRKMKKRDTDVMSHLSPNCEAMLNIRTGFILTERCRRINHYTCEVRSLVVRSDELPYLSKGYTCPQEGFWVGSLHTCYAAFNGDYSKKTWLDASAACKTFGGNLARIDSMPVHNHVKNLLFGEDRYWIGLSDVKGDNSLTYVNGTTFASDSFHYWPQGANPLNNVNGDDCVAMSRDGNWTINYCGMEAGYVCQTQAIKL